MTAQTPGGVALDSFAGSTDDDKLTAALSFIAAQTVKPPLLFDNRRYSFAKPDRVWFSGLKLVGPHGHGNQQRGANSIPNDVRFTGSGVWWRLAPGSVFDAGAYGLSFQGNKNAQFLAGGSSVLWTSVFRDLGFNLWKHVLGKPGEKLLITAVLFDGWWNTNNCYDTAYTLGGSDSVLWTASRHIVDVGGGETKQLFPAGAPLIYLDYLQKTEVGGLYVTCEGNVTGLRITGNKSQGPLTLRSIHVEGRNPGAPCRASNVRIEGGLVLLDRPWLSFWAGSESTAPLVVTGGDVEVDTPSYDRANETGEDKPWLVHTGGRVRVERMKTAERGGAWSRLPRYRSTADVRVDDTMVRV